MWCDPPLTDILQPSQSNWPMSLTASNNEKKQLSFVYQPGVRLYDKKKTDLDQDLRFISTATDVDERIQSVKYSPTSTSDVDRRWSSPSSTESSSSSSSSPTTKADHSYKSCLRRQNEQDALPIRQKLFSTDKDSSANKIHNQIKVSDINIPTNRENILKRKSDQNLLSNKKYHSSLNENSKCEKNLLDKELNHQKSKLITNETYQPTERRSNANERLQKQSITSMIKNIPLVKKLSSENQKPAINSTEKEVPSIPLQGLLLCPKDEPIKKKKKKKIAPTITSNTELLDDDPVLDSILFNEMQSVQQQWQQFLTLTMEKELHVNPSDGKRKVKLNKFQRTNEFLLAYENLYDFEGMKHWYPTSR